MVCGLTSQGADHGDGCEGAGQALAAHDGSGVGGGEQACHAEQAALQNRAARLTGEPHRETPKKYIYITYIFLLGWTPVKPR